MKNRSSIIWGVILIVVGIIIGLNALQITDISIFFDGWWTFLIIIPCFIDLLDNKDITGNLIGILIGVILLFCCQGVLDFEWVWKLFVPVILVLVGLSFIFKDNVNKKVQQKIDSNNKAQKSSKDVEEVYATFGSQKLDYSNQKFIGCSLNAIFGGIECDLRNSIIENDCIISTNSIFGGINICVPDNVVVKVTSNSVFGGVSNKIKSADSKNKKTIYIQATCVFGGVEIK